VTSQPKVVGIFIVKDALSVFFFKEGQHTRIWAYRPIRTWLALLYYGSGTRCAFIKAFYIYNFN